MRVHLLIAGRVQGVWYRASTQQQAQELGLSGWIRNLSDGRVEAEVQGPEDAVEELVAWCQRGPAHAHVTQLRRTPLPEDPNEAGFKVLR